MDLYCLEQTNADVPTETLWLSATEIDCLRSLRFAKRRADWLLGRWTAKQALAAWFGSSTDFSALANLEILAASSGEPEVFLGGQRAGVAISLSHRAGTALCVFTASECKLGCDLEMVEPRIDAFLADYFTESEKKFIVRASPQERILLLALLWSGKESVLKALHVGLRADTRSVSVSLGHSPQQAAGKWFDAADLHEIHNSGHWSPLTGCYSGAELFTGWWRLQNNLVRTVLSNVPLDIPLRHPVAAFVD